MKIMTKVLKESLFIILIACLIGLLTNIQLIEKYVNNEFDYGFVIVEKEFTPSEITIYEAEELFQKGKALFIDARPEEDFKIGHILGALNIPLNSIKSPEDLKTLNLPKNKMLITYCEGGDCKSSIYLAYYLLKAGYRKVKVLIGGWPGWLEAGLPREGS